jgi:DNA topoisomerase-1
MAKKTNKGEQGPGSTGKKLVIVESPTKAKTIRKFLGKDYMVESCMGHIRDLPQSSKDIPEKFKKFKWAQLGVNVDDHFDPIYCIPKNKEKVVQTLKSKLADADELFLATDEDREGESISWHLSEVLKPKVPTKRMVFNEITKEAIQRSLKETRKIDDNLVRAQEARRILDRLVGYTISPLLWKKIAYGLSAGRVQSVAVKLISEKEHERIKFVKSQYWGLTAQLSKGKESFSARLVDLSGKRVATGKDFDPDTGKLIDIKNTHLLTEDNAKKLSEKLLSKDWIVSEVEEKPVFRKPSPPFITSTLQQESNRKLGLSSRETMRVAQKLYEEGFITYMRTDSTFLSAEALQAARDCIRKKYGSEYLPPKPREFDAKKVKGAQEAHEAIRPSGSVFLDPEQTQLTGIHLKLYDLIWKRTVASQMVDSKQKQVSAQISVDQSIFVANGNTIEFPGFLRAYVEGSDDPDAELAEREVRLPKLNVKDQLKCKEIDPAEHETKPPARFTEASLVQKMEKEGIGRPSTYASIIGTIIDRGYVKKEGNALVPTFTALVVSKLLAQHLETFVDLKFTSEMEKALDTIADGDLDLVKYLSSLYKGTQGLKSIVEKQEKKIDPAQAREIKLPGLEQFVFRVGKYGAYVCTQIKDEEVCTSIPEAQSPAEITSENIFKWIDQKLKGHDALGKDPKTGLPIYVLNGRFGPYVQLGEISKENDKPKRVSIPAAIKWEELKLEQALELLSLPKNLGLHPKTKKEIKAGLGRFGPFVVCDGDYRSIPKTDDLFNISLERALELLSQPKKGRGRAVALKELGLDPQSNDKVEIYDGKYGPYVKCGKINVSLPDGASIEKVTLTEALELLKTKAKPLLKGRKKKS